MFAQPLPIGASSMGIDVTKLTLFLEKHFFGLVKCDFKVWFNIIKYKYGKEIHFCVISYSKNFILSMFICSFAAFVPAEPFYNA